MPMDNPLMPQASPDASSAGSPAGDSAGSPHLPGLVDEMNQAKAQHDKLVGSAGTLAKVREELDALTKLGDTVTAEDVIKGAGGLVAAGLTPKAVTALLADMPPGGEALASWLKAHDADVTAREQQLEQVHSAVRHDMGVKAMRVLAAHGQGQLPMPQPAAPAPAPAPASAGSMNPLGA